MRALLLTTAFACSLAVSPAAAAPVSGVQATLQISIPGLASITAVGTGTVDVTGSTLLVPAGLVAAGAITVPVTAVSAVNSLVLTKLSNLSATFSLGGGTGQVAGETCPPLASHACVDGGGIGGTMGLTGLLNLSIIPSIVAFPFNLNAMRVGQGGVGSGVFSTEAAPWTTGVARQDAGAYAFFPETTTGSNTGNTISLVTSTFVAACGNLAPIVGRFTLVGVPEPAATLLLAMGAAGVAWLFLRR